MENENFITLFDDVKIPASEFSAVCIQTGTLIQAHANILKATHSLNTIFTKAGLTPERSLEIVRKLNQSAADTASDQLMEDIKNGRGEESNS